MDPMEASLAAADATGPRFAIITEDNISGYLWITTVLCLVYLFLVIFVRWHVKWNLYGLDDDTATLATFLQLGGSISLFLSLNNGLGKAEKLQNPSWVEKAGKLFGQQDRLMDLMAAYTYTDNICITNFHACVPIYRQNARLPIFCSTSSPTTWTLLGSMRRYIKLQVVTAFSLRFPVIGFPIAHLHRISSYNTGANTETSKKIVPAIMYLQLELFWALLRATIPTLKAFMRSFNSRLGMEVDLDGYGSASVSRGVSYRLKTLSKPDRRYSTMGSKVTTKLRQNNETNGISDGDRIRPDNVSTETSAYRTKPSTSIDGESQEMIIKREVGWTVSYDPSNL
ncbi:hypothetical protein BCR34DRAFT_582986 [Clohesyomyces aquaticus]|uniref:Uncharacterized protein n=1 Tax=Clohesyomyces aquaticus TaxID=1231657 RepID=A0A1Y2A729_9PLEO|nr:hypothetical protein BCR34DRAFT_582986 [Clohesyomyces aquaticus]